MILPGHGHYQSVNLRILGNPYPFQNIVTTTGKPMFVITPKDGMAIILGTISRMADVMHSHQRWADHREEMS